MARIRVISPEGKSGTVSEEKLTNAIAAGFKQQGSFDSASVSGIPVLNPTQEGPDYSAEDVLPTVGGVLGGLVGGAATLSSGAGVPFGATAGATIGGGFGQTAKNFVRVLRDKPVPSLPLESLKESGVEGLKQGGAALAGAGIVKGLEKVFVGLPRVLMNKVMGVNKKRLQAEALDKVEEIGTEAAKEWSNFGRSSSEILDRVKKELPQIGKEISKKVDETYAKNKAFVYTTDIFDEALNPIIKRLEPNPANAKIIESINGSGLDSLRSRYLSKYGNKITLPELEKLKISLYDDIADTSWWKANETLPDRIKGTIALARTARRKISNLVPGISDLNEQYGLYSSMKAFLAGTEAGSGKSITKLFLEPAYEKTLTSVAVPLQNFGAPVRVALPAVAPGVQAEIGRRRIGLPLYRDDER